MNRSGENLSEQVKAIALETLRVVAVVLCWAVALPIVLIALLGIILWDKVEKMALALSTRFSRRTPAGKPLHKIPVELKGEKRKEAATSR